MQIKEPMVTLARYQQLEQHHEALCADFIRLQETLHDWVMMVLAPQDGPSPNGIYHPRKISARWKSLIQSYKGWENVVHFEEYLDEITNERVCQLWRRVDWLAEAPQRAAHASELRMKSAELMERRYRVWRTQQQLVRLGMGRKNALDVIKNIVGLIGKLDNATAMLDALTPVPFSAPLDEEFTDFCEVWRSVQGHVYEDEYDLKGNEV